MSAALRAPIEPGLPVKTNREMNAESAEFHRRWFRFMTGRDVLRLLVFLPDK